MTRPMLSEIFLDMLGAEPQPLGLAPDPGVLFPAQGFFETLAEQEGRVVRRGAEFDRIAVLSRRSVDRAEQDSFIKTMNHATRRSHGTMHLRPIQAWALLETLENQGLFAPIGVGQGKTLIGLLLPHVLDVKRFVYLTQPGLVAQLNRDMDRLNEHFHIRKDAITVVSYSQLSTAKNADLLNRLAPDVIFADEVHALRHPSAARTKRFLRYMQAHPETIFCAASGTITARSLKDYAHLCALALKDKSPVPLRPGVVQEWALALDAQFSAGEQRNAPGALLDFCAPGESPREGFRRRLVETPGVVATTESVLGTGLEIRSLAPDMPRCVELAQQCGGQGSWNGIELDPLHLVSVQRQLALGFHYQWNWPGEPDEEWLHARNAWSRAVRQFLESNKARPGLDSPLLLARACADGMHESWGLKGVWERWVAVKGRPEPPTVPVWHDRDELASVVMKWLDLSKSDIGCIIWYEHTAIGEALANGLQSMRYVKPGDDAALYEGQDLILSIKAHGTGRNLQAWSRNLVLTPPASGAAWEQLIARTHRPGQNADTVTFDVLQHTTEYCGALRRARQDAQYIEATTGQHQKLNLATFVEV